jgi:hypothetical protein
VELFRDGFHDLQQGSGLHEIDAACIDLARLQLKHKPALRCQQPFRTFDTLKHEPLCAGASCQHPISDRPVIPSHAPLQRVAEPNFNCADTENSEAPPQFPPVPTFVWLHASAPLQDFGNTNE